MSEHHESCYTVTSEAQPGMSLRDYFAAHVRPILDIDVWRDAEKQGPEAMAALVATASYAMADAMLKARDAKP